MSSLKQYFPNPTKLLLLEKGFKPTSTRSWSRDIKKLYNNTCIVTGLTTSDGHKLVAHHLQAKQTYPQFTFSLLNGVPLIEGCHKEFHSLYGLNASIESFEHYIQLKQAKTKSSFEFERYVKLKAWIVFLKNQLKNTKEGL